MNSRWENRRKLYTGPLAFPPSHPRGIPKPPEVGGRAGKGESSILPSSREGAQGGHLSREGAELRKRPQPPLQLCSARAAPSHRSALLPGDSGRQTTAHCHVALRNPSSTADPQADYTHTVQSHRHHYGQSDTDYMCTIMLHAYTAAFNNYTQILRQRQKPRRNAIIASRSCSSSILLRAHHSIHTHQEPSSLTQKQPTFQKKPFNFSKKKSHINIRV